MHCNSNLSWITHENIGSRNPKRFILELLDAQIFKSRKATEKASFWLKNSGYCANVTSTFVICYLSLEKWYYNSIKGGVVRRTSNNICPKPICKDRYGSRAGIGSPLSFKAQNIYCIDNHEQFWWVWEGGGSHDVVSDLRVFRFFVKWTKSLIQNYTWLNKKVRQAREW